MRKLIVLLVLFCAFAPTLAFAQPTPIPAPPADSLGVQPPVMQPAPMLEQLRDLQAKYQALKDSKDKSAKMLLWAALIAAGLKMALSAVNALAGKKPKQWLALVALVLAVPIALLSHFAAGNSWFDSLIYAGAGPGAIVVHELVKIFTRKPAEASA